MEKPIKFNAYNPFLKQLRADKGFRIELDISQDQYDLIKDIPKMEDVILNVTIEVQR